MHRKIDNSARFRSVRVTRASEPCKVFPSWDNGSSTQGYAYVRGCIPLPLAILKVSTRCRIVLSLRFASRFLYRYDYSILLSSPLSSSSGSSRICQTSLRRLESLLDQNPAFAKRLKSTLLSIILCT